MKAGALAQERATVSLFYNSSFERIQNTKDNNILANGIPRTRPLNLLGLQAKFNHLQVQFQALAAKHVTLQSPHLPPLNQKELLNLTRTRQELLMAKPGTTAKNGFSGQRWNKTHRSDEHRRGVGKRGKSNAENDLLVSQ